MVPRRVSHALPDGHRDGQVCDDDNDDDDDDDGDGCDDNDYNDDDDRHVCGQAADESLPWQHHRVLCVILREHLLAPADLLPR